MNDEPAFVDWRPAHHFQTRSKPCRFCGGMTPLRDDAGNPSHKVCYEKELNRDPR